MNTIEDAVHRYSALLYRLALAKTGNIHDAQDITQEVFYKLLRAENAGKVFDDEEHRKAWLIRVAVNAGKSLVGSAFKRGYSGEIDERVSGDVSGTDDAVSRLETRETVRPAVLSLPEKYRVIIHLFYYEDMGIDGISKVTGLGVNTVKSRLHRARNMLREKLREVDFDDF